MQTPASISKPSVHPLLIALPVGLWVVSLLCDLLYLVGGFAGALTALTLPGFVAHMNVALVVVALYALNIWLRLGDPHLTIAIALSVTGVGVLALSSWVDHAISA